MDRLIDSTGAAWPAYPTTCPVCQLPADPVLDGAPHPNCLPDADLDADTRAAAVALLADVLGATPIGTFTNRFLVSGESIPLTLPTAREGA